MKPQFFTRLAGISLAMLALASSATPAAAQWDRVTVVPATDVFNVWANGDTIVATTNHLVYTSTNGGASWHPSTTPSAAVAVVSTGRVRNGRLYAGTYGQGVFVSDDLGDTWQAFNQGLTGGFANSQLTIDEFEILGDNLYAATSGAGVYIRNLATVDTWHHFGEEFEPNQASNVNSILAGGSRLVTCAGGNGSVLFRDPAQPDWTISWLDNVGLEPGLMAQTAGFTGSGWVVGTNVGVFRSALGQEPWTFTGLGLGDIFWSTFATRGQRLFAAFSILHFAVIETSGDNGATWQELERIPEGFVYKVAMSGNDLYGGFRNGLFRRSTATVSVPDPTPPSTLRFAIAGEQPVRDQVRFRFELPQDGMASIDLFDVTGRRVADRIAQSFAAGTHEVSWSTRALQPGVFAARLTSNGRSEVVRLVHVR